MERGLRRLTQSSGMPTPLFSTCSRSARITPVRASPPKLLRGLWRMRTSGLAMSALTRQILLFSAALRTSCHGASPGSAATPPERDGLRCPSGCRCSSSSRRSCVATMESPCNRRPIFLTSISPRSMPNVRFSSADQDSKSMTCSSTCRIRRWPGTKTWPALGKREWPRSLSSVVLPAPCAPLTATTPPCGALRLTSRRTGCAGR
mmetsp:Transcript_18088/g.56948  ORF Transcript_18088/g.56948 Transcript_18088/m.56948 type:complete len:205 (+) Transcript_18088:487-1101(+)